MLLRDVAKEDIRKRNLAQIYTNYFVEKFHADRHSSTQNPAVLRPLSLKEDSTVACAQLLDVMACAASKMYQIGEGMVRLLPDLTETELRNCINTVSQGERDLPSVLSNSVMIPVGRRRIETQRALLLFTFAHKSFQAFFLARYVLEMLLGNAPDFALVRHLFRKAYSVF
jgi:hypothetical protein